MQWISIARLSSINYHFGAMYTISEAQKKIEQILRQVEAGQEVVITHRNTPVAKFIPIAPRKVAKKKQASSKS